MWNGEERRRNNHDLSDEVIDEIANRAAEKALEKVYIEVGKSVIKKIMWIAGAVIIGIFMYLSTKGVIK